MSAPAPPRTPTIATTTAERRCAEVGTGNEASMAASGMVVVFEEVGSGSE